MDIYLPPSIMSEILEPGQVGRFSIKKDVVSKGTVLNGYDRHSGRIIRIKYDFNCPILELTEDGDTWMSDTQLEMESVEGAALAARGNVLVGGLGIGLFPTLIRKKVKHIDIVEIHREVIDLVFPQIATRKMRVVCDDISHYLETTDRRYDFIHIDIWNDLLAPIQEIDKMRELASRCLRPGGTVWCWLQELCDRVKGKLPSGPVGNPGPPAIYDPCLICGKAFRYDYAGLCLDCSDGLGVSEMFLRR